MNKIIILLPALIIANAVFSMENSEGKEQYRNQAAKPYVFDKGKDTKIMGNRLFSAVHINYQENPSSQFEHTLFVHYTKKGEYREKFTVKDLKKAYNHTHPDKRKIWNHEELYSKHAGANNAIVCPNLLQITNRDGELKDIAVVIFGTQNTDHCDRFKNFLDQQNLPDPEYS